MPRPPSRLAPHGARAALPRRRRADGLFPRSRRPAAAHLACSPCFATRSACRASSSSSCCSSPGSPPSGGCGPRSQRPSAGFLLVNWYFTPPLHTFTIARGREPPGADRLRGGRRARQRASSRSRRGGRSRARELAPRRRPSRALAGSSSVDGRCSKACGARWGFDAAGVLHRDGASVAARGRKRRPAPATPDDATATFEVDPMHRARRWSVRARPDDDDRPILERIRAGARRLPPDRGARGRGRPAPAAWRPRTSSARRSYPPSRTTSAHRSRRSRRR